jgi:hypothetical protein
MEYLANRNEQKKSWSIFLLFLGRFRFDLISDNRSRPVLVRLRGLASRLVLHCRTRAPPRLPTLRNGRRRVPVATRALDGPARTKVPALQRPGHRRWGRALALWLSEAALVEGRTPDPLCLHCRGRARRDRAAEAKGRRAAGACPRLPRPVGAARNRRAAGGHRTTGRRSWTGAVAAAP